MLRLAYSGGSNFLSERQARLQRQAKDRLILRFVITVSLAVFVLLTVYLVFNNIADNIAIHSRETVTPRAGMMEESGKAQAVIVQKETVYYAPGEGNFTPCIREGERVRRNIEAGIFVSSGGGKINVKVPATGVFTQNTDGLEKVFEGCTLTELGPEVFAYKSSKANPSGHYYAENAVFKIIDNFEPQGIVALLADKPPVGLKSKDHVLLQYNGLEPFQAQVLKINPVNEQYYLYLKKIISGLKL
jgi:hypothetical protein